jgi:hypothetical protein
MAMKSIELHDPPNTTKKSIELAKIMISPRQKILAKFTKEPPLTPKQNRHYLAFIAPLAPHKNIHKP